MHAHFNLLPTQLCACMLYPIPLGDAEGASSGVAQLIQTTQGHRIRLASIGNHLHTREYKTYKLF